MISSSLFATLEFFEALQRTSCAVRSIESVELAVEKRDPETNVRVTTRGWSVEAYPSTQAPYGSKMYFLPICSGAIIDADAACKADLHEAQMRSSHSGYQQNFTFWLSATFTTKGK